MDYSFTWFNLPEISINAKFQCLKYLKLTGQCFLNKQYMYLQLYMLLFFFNHWKTVAEQYFGCYRFYGVSVNSEQYFSKYTVNGSVSTSAREKTILKSILPFLALHGATTCECYCNFSIFAIQHERYSKRNSKASNQGCRQKTTEVLVYGHRGLHSTAGMKRYLKLPLAA